MAGLSIISMPPGMMPAPITLLDAFAGVFRAGEADQQSARGLGLFQDADGDFGDDAEKAFGAGDDAEQIIAAGIQMLAADADDLAGDQHHFQAEQVVGGHAVFQAMHAAGILRDIAADGAGDLRGRIGRVIEALVLDRLGDAEIGDAGLHHRDAIDVIDLADAENFAMPRSTPSPSGSAPPDSEVPAPRGTTLILLSWQ